MRAATGRMSRRAFLGGAVALGAVACRHHESAPPDPDAARTAAARDGEARIVAAYTALAAAAGPQQATFARLRDLHGRHLAALGGAPPTPGVTGVTAAAATALVSGSVATLQGAAVTAVSGQRAALLASIAASHLTQAPRGAAR